MTIYLIRKGNELFLIPVRPQQEAAFLANFGQKIIMSGDSIQEVLRKFNDMPVILCNGF